MKRIYLLALTLLLVAACSPSKEKQLEKIHQQEVELDMYEMGIDSVQVQKVIGLYQKFIHDFPDDSLAPVFYVRIADVSITLGNFDDAVASLDSVINNYPGYEDLGGCWFLKGVAYENAGQIDSARSMYTTFVEEYPEHPLAPDTKTSLQYLGMSPEEMLMVIQANDNTNNTDADSGK